MTNGAHTIEFLSEFGVFGFWDDTAPVEAITEPMTRIVDAIRQASLLLAASGSESPRLDADVLLRHVLKLDRTALIVHMNDVLDPHDELTFRALISRRERGEPVAYLTEQREFYGRPFKVGPGVLVPRPETELLVDWASEVATRIPAGTVVDVGTGSGAIALSLADALPRAWGGRIVGVDLSGTALGYAADNRRILTPLHGVELVRGSLLDWCGGPIDIVVANLPYLRPDQWAANVDLVAEPELALVSGADGLDAIRRLVADLPRVLSSRWALGIELDPAQASTVAHLVERTLPGGRVEIRPDLARLERFVLATNGL